MARQITEAAKVAKIIRAELKKNGVVGKVKSSNYSMGNSVNVTIENPLPATLKKVGEFCEQFEGGHFDGMQDLYIRDNSKTGPTTKYLFVQADYDDAIVAEAEKFVTDSIQGLVGYQISEYANRALSGQYGNFWTSRKPRKLAA